VGLGPPTSDGGAQPHPTILSLRVLVSSWQGSFLNESCRGLETKIEKLEIVFTPVGALTYAATDAYNFVDCLTIRAGPHQYGGASFRPPAERRKLKIKM